MKMKSQKYKISLPVPGEGDAQRKEAKRLAAQAIKKKRFKGTPIKRSSLVEAMFGSSLERSEKYHQSYFAAYVEKKAGEAYDEKARKAREQTNTLENHLRGFSKACSADAGVWICGSPVKKSQKQAKPAARTRGHFSAKPAIGYGMGRNGSRRRERRGIPSMP